MFDSNKPNDRLFWRNRVATSRTQAVLRRHRGPAGDGAHRLRLALGRPVGPRLTVSIGVACFPEHATQPEELLRAADEALYEAKLQGRDRVVTAGPRLLPLTARPGQVKGRAARVE